MSDTKPLTERLRTDAIFDNTTLGNEAADAIEALQKEVSTLDVLLEECKMDWSGDVTQLKAEHKHEIEALQSKLGDAIQSSAHWQHQFTEAQAENERLTQDRDEWRDSTIAANQNAASETRRREDMQDQRDQLKSQLDAMGKGEPVAWQFRTNGKHWHVVQVCPPDDAYDKGTLSPLYAAPKALAPLARVAECAARLVEHADFQLGGILSADSKAKDIPSKAVSQVKSRHLAALRDSLAAHGIGGTP
jgi:hypothetical protein